MGLVQRTDGIFERRLEIATAKDEKLKADVNTCAEHPVGVRQNEFGPVRVQVACLRVMPGESAQRLLERYLRTVAVLRSAECIGMQEKAGSLTV